MRDKYLAIKICTMALQMLGFIALMAAIMAGSTAAGVVGMLAGLVGGSLVLALCFGLAEVLTLLTDVERTLRGLRDDLHERLPRDER